MQQWAIMRGHGGSNCDFCDVEAFRASEVFLENDSCLYAATISGKRVLPGSGIVVPLRHVESPFDLTEHEWLDTRALVLAAKELLDEHLAPDGYNLGWNVMPTAGQEVAHVHLHLLPRFADEPAAGKGLRWLFKQPTNLRPHPSAPGQGDAAGSD